MSNILDQFVVKAYKDESWTPTHRGVLGIITHYVANLDGSIDGIDVVIVKEGVNNCWLITPNHQEDEQHMEDLGPYETMEDAILHFKLIADT